MSTGIIPISSRRIRTIKTKGYSRSSLPLINKEDYAILYGLILGDLYISRKNTGNASLRFEQSIIHEQYLNHLFAKFNYLPCAHHVLQLSGRLESYIPGEANIFSLFYYSSINSYYRTSYFVLLKG